MSGGAKIIDFQEAARRFAKTRKVAPITTAITPVPMAKRVSLDEIERVLQQNPELDYLREKGVDIRHIALWLERFPAMSLEELVGILQYAVREVKRGGNDRIIDYLFQPLAPE